MSRHHGNEDGQGLDPIALTLAVWLGVITGTTGLIRMSHDAAAQTELAQAASQAQANRSGLQENGKAPVLQTAEPAGLFDPRMIAFGG